MDYSVIQGSVLVGALIFFVGVLVGAITANISRGPLPHTVAWTEAQTKKEVALAAKIDEIKV